MEKENKLNDFDWTNDSGYNDVFDDKVIHKTYIDNSRFMELIGELATQITEMNFGADTYYWYGENEHKFTDEAQEYYNEMYDEYEELFNNLGNIYSKN